MVGKKAQLFIKAKREQVKVQDNQFRASLSCLQRKKGRREEEDGEREAEGKVGVKGWGGAYTGRIRTKAFLAPVETLMRVQIHYCLINHDTL